MDWDNKFARQKENEALQRDSAEAERREHLAVAQRERAAASQVVKDVVIPLFREVAKAANRNGRYGEAVPNEVTVPTGAISGQVALGARLALSKAPPHKGRPNIQGNCGVIEIRYLQGDSFLLKIQGDEFNVDEEVNRPDLTKEKLSNYIDRIIDDVFKH